jgi:hypothetical protein
VYSGDYGDSEQVAELELDPENEFLISFEDLLKYFGEAVICYETA